MKKYLLTTVIIFFTCLVALNAQDQEKKKVHLKIVKEENGKVTEIDTVFEGIDKDGMYFLGDIDGMDINIDSILKEFNIEGHEGMKFMTISDKHHSKDSLKHFWHTIDADMEGDSVKIKKMIFISEDGDVKHGEHGFVHGDGKKVKIIKKEIGDSMVWSSDSEGNINIEEHEGLKYITITEHIDSDDSKKQVWHTYKTDMDGDSVKMKKMIIISDDGDGKHGDHVFVHGDGKKVKVIKKEGGESMVWTSEDEGDVQVTKEGNVIIYKTGDETFDIMKSEGGEKIMIKEFHADKSDGKEKTIEVIVTEGGDHSIVKIMGDDDLMHTEGNVKIYKYKTDDGKITVKAEITDSEKGEKKKVKKEFKKIKISPNPTDGKFNLEFELSNKENVVIKVKNESGKSVYSKKVKKFNGKFSEEIDISKEEPGTYFILITQGGKTIKNKIVKN